MCEASLNVGHVKILSSSSLPSLTVIHLSLVWIWVTMPPNYMSHWPWKIIFWQECNSMVAHTPAQTSPWNARSNSQIPFVVLIWKLATRFSGHRSYLWLDWWYQPKREIYDKTCKIHKPLSCNSSRLQMVSVGIKLNFFCTASVTQQGSRPSVEFSLRWGTHTSPSALNFSVDG